MSEAPVATPSRKELQGAESRRRILDAASALMSERGFAGTSISALSRRSGLPASSIYWHFGSKEGLLGAVVEDGAQRWFEGLPKLEELPGDREERFEVMLDATARSLEEQPEFLRLLMLIALERREIDASSLESIRRARSLAQDGIFAWIRRTTPELDEPLARRLSLYTMVVADGLFLQHHIDPDGTDVRALLGLLADTLQAAIERQHVPV